MTTVFIRSPYNYDMDRATLETALHCKDDSLAIQSAAEEADINTIVRRFGLTGELPGDIKMPQSGDFAGIGDFQSAMNVVRAAQEEFLRVPADIRARFMHDPQVFSDFFNDPANQDEAIRLGLATRKVVDSALPNVEAKAS
ncbi:MAG: internal scaffolding protein [Microvirus sp.]|nr:MAG: internal scaffolding protein [Microvirus sp.]